MIALALLLLVQDAPHLPPADWSKLPLLATPGRHGGDPSEFVKAEVAAGRCAAATSDPTGNRLNAPVAVLIGETGGLIRVVPQAIDCPTVEQYTVGYVSTLLRSLPGDEPGRPAPGWYRLPVTYRW